MDGEFASSVPAWLVERNSHVLNVYEVCVNSGNTAFCYERCTSWTSGINVLENVRHHDCIEEICKHHRCTHRHALSTAVWMSCFYIITSVVCYCYSVRFVRYRLPCQLWQFVIVLQTIMWWNQGFTLKYLLIYVCNSTYWNSLVNW
jgi:hypothetical protein